MKKTIVLILNVLIVIFTIIGVTVMVARNGGMFTAAGWDNLKYFTVLSNIFCGIVAAVYLVKAIRHMVIARNRHSRNVIEGNTDKHGNYTCDNGVQQSFAREGMMAVKLMSATAVAVTFLMIAGFFGPLYGWSKLYQGSNFWFHLVIPVLAMTEFVLLKGRIRFGVTVSAMIPALVYGVFYLVNNLVNGTGEWPDTNDWYGFLNWGLPVGIVIFFGVAAVSFAAACVMRFVNLKINRGTDRK